MVKNFQEIETLKIYCKTFHFDFSHLAKKIGKRFSKLQLNLFLLTDF